LVRESFLIPIIPSMTTATIATFAIYRTATTMK
jgi:hypothetical protein